MGFFTVCGESGRPSAQFWRGACWGKATGRCIAPSAWGLAFFVTCLSYLAFSQAPTLAWAALCVMLGHLGGSVQWVFSTTLLQKAVADRYRGRVFAAEMALLTLVLSISIYLTGAALNYGWDPRDITVVLALIFLLPGAVWTIHAKRRLRR